MNEIVSSVKRCTLYEVYDMCQNWKASVLKKDVYNVCNEEIVNRLRKQEFDEKTIVFILKTFVLAEDDLQHVEQSMNLSYLLRNTDGVALTDKMVDVAEIRKLYANFIKKVEDINKNVKESLPDTDKARAILQGYKDIASIYEETKKYNKVMAEMLDIHIEYEKSTLDIKNLPSFKLYSLLHVDTYVNDYYIEDYITFFYDYFDMALDVFETFIQYYEKLMTLDYVKEEVKHSSIDSDCYDDPKKVKVLLNHTIFALNDLLDEENQMGVEWYDRDELAETALKIVEERFTEGLFDKDSLDLLEKALLLGFAEENVKKAWIYISMILNQIEGLDFSDDVLKLSLVEGELSQATQKLFTFDNLFDDMDNVNDFVLESLIEIEGKEVLKEKIGKIATVFEGLLDRYYDYIQNVEEELEEDYVAELLKRFNIQSEDPLDYMASVIEYYEDYDHKLFKLRYAL